MKAGANEGMVSNVCSASLVSVFNHIKLPDSLISQHSSHNTLNLRIACYCMPSNLLINSSVVGTFFPIITVTING